MPRICTVCTHRDRKSIDTAIVTCSGSIRGIARQHGLKLDALLRHRDSHLRDELMEAQRARVAESITLREKIDSTWEGLARSLAKAEKSDLSAVAPIAAQMHKNAELHGQLTGELSPDRGQTNIALVFDSPRGELPAATPVYQPSSVVESTALSAGASTAITDADNTGETLPALPAGRNG